MATSELILTLVVFGANDSGVKLEFRPRFPTHLDQLGRTNWAGRFIFNNGGLLKDAKYSHDWGCEFCGKPAREAMAQNIFWMEKSPPLVTVFLHAMCTTEPGPCMDMMRTAEVEIAGMVNMRPNDLEGRSDGKVFPLLSACAGCEHTVEELVSDDGEARTLKRCGGCHLTRYCSDTCQKREWSRHKAACKSLKNLEWHLT